MCNPRVALAEIDAHMLDAGKIYNHKVLVHRLGRWTAISMGVTELDNQAQIVQGQAVKVFAIPHLKSY
jgi:hypothetical protein